jgi:uncharacterized protein with NRDE domain
VRDTAAARPPRPVCCANVCTVLLRYTPGAEWPLLMAAVRDEFVDRSWDPPATHWPDTAPGVVGGRDCLAGGTWLAVRRSSPAVAALLNGAHVAPPIDGVRQSRGWLALAALTGSTPNLDRDRPSGYDGFHLLHATPSGVVVWSWDGVAVRRQDLDPGNHIVVNRGLDADDPLVKHFMPLLISMPTVHPHSGVDTATAWGAWVDLLRGDGLATDDPRALVVRHEAPDGRVYGSTSASLVAVGHGGVRFDFTATPQRPSWTEISLFE